MTKQRIREPALYIAQYSYENPRDRASSQALVDEEHERFTGGFLIATLFSLFIWSLAGFTWLALR